MQDAVISGSGLYTPSESVTNAELVASFNQYVHDYNQAHQHDIAAGRMEPLSGSSAEFILKASGVQQRHVVDKIGILDLNRMYPKITKRTHQELSLQCEMAVAAALQALQAAGKKVTDIDVVLVACTATQRAFPGIAIEVQAALGIQGFAFDMQVACSSATFGIHTAAAMINSQQARGVLVINPEICSAQLNFKDRDSHFIFGDACTALVIEAAQLAQSAHAFQIVSTRLKTQFSNNIRSDFGFLNRAEDSDPYLQDKLFKQNGRQVFKDVVPLAASLINQHLTDNAISPSELKRLWLHQANINMNQLIAHKVLGRDATLSEAPLILGKYANTSSAGSVIAFHHYHHDLAMGNLGVLCSFGAGYSIGNIILRKIAT